MRSRIVKKAIISLNLTIIFLLILGVLFCFLIPIDFYLEFQGIIKSQNEAILKTKHEGIIGKVFIEEGAKVKEGEIILKLNDTKISVDKIETEMEYDKLRQDYENANALYEKGIISKVDFLEKERDFEVAKLKLEKLESFEIKAPMNGTLVSSEELWLREGDYVEMGTVIARIIDLDKMMTKISIPERKISKIKVGQKAVIFANALPFLKRKAFDGEVIKILPEAKPEEDNTTFVVLVRIKDSFVGTKNSQFRLLPMMTAKVRILYAHKTLFGLLMEDEIGYETQN